MSNREPYPSDVSNEEWAFVAPYLALLREDAPQRTHDLREVFNGLRWIVRTGSPWRYMPNDLPPWEAVYQQTQRWLSAGVFEAMVHDLRALLRLAEGRNEDPTAAILDSSRTLRSTPESGGRAGYDGAKRKRGSKVHAAVDTLGHLLAMVVTPADEHDREQVEKLAEAVQEATGERVLSWLMWIRDIVESSRQPRPKRTVSSLRWSSTKRPSVALCFCRGGG
jgi:transposase